jgi:ferric-dicitrate binding protein FerR (iron transport regulator)
MSPYESVDPKLFAQAMTWVCRMSKPGDDLEDPYTDPGVRQAAFAAWLRASPRHVWAYIHAAEYFKELRKHAPPTTTQARDTMTTKSAHRGFRRSSKYSTTPLARFAYKAQAVRFKALIRLMFIAALRTRRSWQLKVR